MASRCLIWACVVVLGCSDAHIAGNDAGPADAGHDGGARDSGPVLRDAGPPDAGPEPVDGGRECSTADGTDLYFGTLRPAPELESVPTSIPGSRRTLRDAYASANGLRLTATFGPPCLEEDPSWGWFAIYERVRASMDDPWPDAAVRHCVSGDVHPHLTADARGLFTWHGGGQHAEYRERSSITRTFNPFDVAHTYVDGIWGATDVTLAGCFVPTPDGAYVAFCSNRTSAADPTALSESARHVWVARANDPADPTADYTDLVPAETSPPDGAQQMPMWISDDALTVLMVSDRDGPGQLDVFRVSRPTREAPFDPPARIDVLSNPATSEDSVTLPSLEAIHAHGCVAEGYLSRALSAESRTLHRFPVCLGAPCE